MGRSVKPETRRLPNKECLLGNENFVSKKELSSFERGNIAWEASTLPLSYTRSNRIYFNPKNRGCKGAVLASSGSAGGLMFLESLLESGRIYDIIAPLILRE
jgi:hypothetical protein